MNYTKEQIEKMADEYANQFMDGKDHFYGFKAGFEKALSLFAVSNCPSCELEKTFNEPDKCMTDGCPNCIF